VEGGIRPDQKFKPIPAFNFSPRRELIELTVTASFVFVWLAKEGHPNPISVNYLEKIQIPHIYHLAGAMLAGVDYVTMGAGITIQIPSVLEALAQGRSPSYPVIVEGSKEPRVITFHPKAFFGNAWPELRQPGFLPIVSTHVLAEFMAGKLPGCIDGFVVEKPIAGGHNAPPRGALVLDANGEPVYGPRDEVNFAKLRDLGIPFWIGGGHASPEGLSDARAQGATGIQVGSIAALCEDSGMDPQDRSLIRRLGYRGELVVRTAPEASPTGYPFKVVQLPGTMSDPAVYAVRERVCDLSALLVPYLRPDGEVGFRCASEPVEDYVRKGGRVENTVGACCLCNGLLSASGFGTPGEAPIFTLGNDVSFLRHLMRHENDSYTLAQAMTYLTSET
jgi:NAD(P)H-dependent flavin oxidoreductase YrpB (nitropropane dioxygenase family)